MKEKQWIDNIIGKAGARQMGEALKLNSSLSKLSLRGGEWGQWKQKKERKEE